jgi:uncharacterized repeat protein (TIGR04052 family)
MRLSSFVPVALFLCDYGFAADAQNVALRFQAMVGREKFACGKTYEGIGTTGSKIMPRDFRLYVHNIRLIDETGKSAPVELEQDGKWQLDDVALLDFEDGTWGCVNGTPDVNDRVIGRVPAGRYSGLRFTVGVPFNKNHTDLTTQPPPLNLTALMWVWNAGRKFARLDLSSTGLPRGYAIHLGSTGCTPNETKITVPTQCSEPNRPEIEITGFDTSRDVVIADLAALLKDSNVDSNQEHTAAGCMSDPNDSDCAPLFANFGLPFAGKPARKQSFFRKQESPAVSMRAER